MRPFFVWVPPGFGNLVNLRKRLASLQISLSRKKQTNQTRFALAGRPDCLFSWFGVRVPLRMSNLRVAAYSIDIVATVTIAAAVLSVHTKIATDRDIDEGVVREMRIEKFFIVFAIVLLLISFVLFIVDDVVERNQAQAKPNEPKDARNGQEQGQAPHHRILDPATSSRARRISTS